MTLGFGDLFSNALHDIKKLSGKKISIIQDEIGHYFDPILSGDTIEKWRYRKSNLTANQLERLAKALLSYGYKGHDRDWLITFLEAGDSSFPEAIANQFFPSQSSSTEGSEPIAPAVKISPPPPIDAFRPPSQTGFVGREIG